jgi:hypothetical protein
MIVYLANKTRFREDILSNRIEEIVHDSFKGVLGKSVGAGELASWKNSLRHMDTVLEDAGIPDNAGVAIEFNIPQTGKRVDFIVTGTREDRQRTAVIVELKQWSDARATTMDAIVSTFVGGREREVNHPSYQAWSYAMLIEDFNETVRQDPIHLRPCAYLHNCASGSVIHAPFYAAHTKLAPAFLRDDAKKLRVFIKAHVKYGDDGETMYRIRDGKLRPSKNLADHLASLIQGNREFYLIDEQKTVYETALHLAKSSSATNKNVLIVNGGPGTGKTVVAINLLVELTSRGLVSQYVTKNSAPRAVYENKLTQTFKKSRISNLFVGSGAFTETRANTFGGLIVDEAHRLNEKSGLFSNLGENQIKELINASTFTVFFLDEDQRIHWKDIGNKSQIRQWAESLGATVTEMDLESQFRCNGSDGYLAWIDRVLQVRETANTTLEGANYEFKVCESATELKELIERRNRVNNKSRMVAGYCWDWVSKKTPTAFDFQLDGGAFKARWNLSDDGPLWIMKPDSVREVGCIHTCQGLELDYVGVIIGPDWATPRKGRNCWKSWRKSRMIPAPTGISSSDGRKLSGWAAVSISNPIPLPDVRQSLRSPIGSCRRIIRKPQPHEPVPPLPKRRRTHQARRAVGQSDRLAEPEATHRPLRQGQGNHQRAHQTHFRGWGTGPRGNCSVIPNSSNGGWTGSEPGGGVLQPRHGAGPRIPGAKPDGHAFPPVGG